MIAKRLGWSEPPPGQIASQAIDRAARRLIGDSVYVELAHGSLGRKELPSAACGTQDLPVISSNGWPDDFSNFLSTLPPEAVYCVNTAPDMSRQVTSMPRLLLVWLEQPAFPTVLKLLWYCGSGAEGECGELRFVPKPTTTVGFDPTNEKEFQEGEKALRDMRVRLHSSLPKDADKDHVEAFGFTEDGLVGFEFVDPVTNRLLRLTALFGLSDAEPYPPPDDTKFEKLDETNTERSGHRNIGIDYLYKTESYRLVRVKKSDEIFVGMGLYSPTIQEMAIDDDYVWLRDSSGQSWRLVHGPDRISAMLVHRHHWQKPEPSLLSSTCRKVGCAGCMN
jgi:hypothetical protein